MANRLTSIVTRTGDDGSTGLANGARVSKADLRIEVIGTVDELNSQIGVVLTELLPPDVHSELFLIQHDLFDLGGALAYPGAPFALNKIERLDIAVGKFNAHLTPLKEFILPGGSRAAALCHVARTLARRAERKLIALRQHESTSENGHIYLNRLSDLLFVMARIINQSSNQSESFWKNVPQ